MLFTSYEDGRSDICNTYMTESRKDYHDWVRWLHPWLFEHHAAFVVKSISFHKNSKTFFTVFDDNRQPLPLPWWIWIYQEMWLNEIVEKGLKTILEVPSDFREDNCMMILHDGEVKNDR